MQLGDQSLLRGGVFRGEGGALVFQHLDVIGRREGEDARRVLTLQPFRLRLQQHPTMRDFYRAYMSASITSAGLAPACDSPIGSY